MYFSQLKFTPYFLMFALLAGCGGDPAQSYNMQNIITENDIEYKDAHKLRTNSITNMFLSPDVVGIKRTTKAEVPIITHGYASWYGDYFNDRHTANRVTFHENFLMAAHREVTLPALAAITNKENGRKLYVLITDRGPYRDVKNRQIDLSRKAARLLGMEHKGVGKVKIEIIENVSNELRGIYKYRDIVRSKKIKSLLNHRYYLKIHVSNNNLDKIHHYLNIFVKEEYEKLRFVGDYIFIGPMHNNLNAFLMFITFKMEGVTSKIYVA